MAAAARAGIQSAVKAADGISIASHLSPNQVEEIDAARTAYLKGPTDARDSERESVERCLRAINIEITQTYLSKLNTGYCPVCWDDSQFVPENRIRYFNITKWIIDTSEKSLDKLTNLYQVLAHEECAIALIYTRKMDGCTVTLAVENCRKSDQPTIANGFCDRLRQAFAGNFPGAELDEPQHGIPQCLETYSDRDTVAAVSNLASERSEDFISQSIEKLLDGIAPRSKEEGYSVVLLAQPSAGLDVRRSRLYDLYSELSPYATWQKTEGFNEMLTNTAAMAVGGGTGIFGIGGNLNRSSAQVKNVGTTEGRSETCTNYGVKHMLDLLENKVKRLEESGSRIYSTQDNGALTVRTDGQHIWISGTA